MSTTYPLSDQVSIAFSALEDRLVVRSHNTNGATVWLLLTRRMTLLVLRQLLHQLHRISDLDKTPAQYWLEVLQMDHQHAMQAKELADQKTSSYSAPLPSVDSNLNPPRSEKNGESAADTAPASQETPTAAANATERALFIATSIHLENYPRYALLAFKGLPMPKAMTNPSPHLPVFAIRLNRDHLHQLIRLLIVKAKEAHWDLPVNLPWIDSPTEQNTSLDLGLLH